MTDEMNGNGNGLSNLPTRQLLELIASRLGSPSAGPVTLNVSPAGSEGKSSVELSENAKGGLQISIKVYSSDTTGASQALDTAIAQYQAWMVAKQGFEALRAVSGNPHASEPEPARKKGVTV